MAFTFKTTKPTGKFKSFASEHHEIKWNKKVVGEITLDFKIRLKVIKKDINEDNYPNCSWKWISFKKEFESLQAAKDFLKEKYAFIINAYQLYQD